MRESGETTVEISQPNQGVKEVRWSAAGGLRGRVEGWVEGVLHDAAELTGNDTGSFARALRVRHQSSGRGKADARLAREPRNR